MNENVNVFDLRIDALEKAFGPMDDEVLNATIPYELGLEMGGSPHVYFFSEHLDGTLLVTAGMIGTEQQPSDAGNYEFMMAFKENNEFGPNLMCPLAYYTQEASLNSGETMDLPAHMTEGSKIKAILFDCYKKFPVGDIDAGVMAIIGITQAELEYKVSHGGAKLIEVLKEQGIYPFTDLNRESVV